MINANIISVLMGGTSGGGSPVNTYDKVNSARTRNNGVFIFNYSNSRHFLRIFTPFNDRYAQFWTLEKEQSASSEYYHYSGVQGVSEYFEILSPTTRTGTWSSWGISSSNYSSVPGSTFSFSFTGIGFKSRSYTDNRGGILRYVITDVATSVVVETVDVSVYSASAGARNLLVTETLPFAEYSVVCTFIGDDPLNVPSGGPGTARGWVAADYVNTGVSIYNRPIFVLGSPTPNFCYPPDTDISNAGTKKHIFSISSHREYAVVSRIDGSATDLDTGFIPLHGVNGNASTFSNLSTDRTLIFDEGSDNLITTIPQDYGFAIGGTSLKLYQKFIGYNPNGSSADQLFDITQTWEWTSQGLKENVRMEALNTLDNEGTTFYISLLDAESKGTDVGFTHIVMPNGDELATNSSPESDYIYSKDDLISGAYNNGIEFSINKTGTDEEKSFVQIRKLNNPVPLMKLNRDFGQTFLTVANGSRRKNYLTVALQSNVDTTENIIAGDTWEWESNWILGFLPDAYNVLKSLM